MTQTHTPLPFPMDGSTFVVESIDRTAYRWAKYKPDGARQMGKPGRWQKQVWHGDFFKWENCEEPTGEISPPIEDGPITKAFKDRDTIASQAAEIARLREALERKFCVIFLDGVNEQGTHVLPSYPRSFDVDENDLSDQAEIIWRDAHMLGFKEGDYVWCDFTLEPAQIGEFGRVELASYWEFSAINKELSVEINRKISEKMEPRS